MSEQKPPNIPYKYSKSANYKQIYVMGATGGIRPIDFRIDFFDDNLIRHDPEFLEQESPDTDDVMAIKESKEDFHIHREYKVGLIMSYQTTVGLYRLLRDQITKAIKNGILNEDALK